MKTYKSTACFVIAMVLFATASTLEFNDLKHIEAQTQGVK